MSEHMQLAYDHYTSYGAIDAPVGSLLRNKRIFSAMYKHVLWYFKKYKNINETMKIYTALNSQDEFESFLHNLVLENGKYLKGKI